MCHTDSPDGLKGLQSNEGKIQIKILEYNSSGIVQTPSLSALALIIIYKK